MAIRKLINFKVSAKAQSIEEEKVFVAAVRLLLQEVVRREVAKQGDRKWKNKDSKG